MQTKVKITDPVLDANDKPSDPSLITEPKELPAVVDGEDLLTWCQRVTKDYSVKITDYTYVSILELSVDTIRNTRFNLSSHFYVLS